jgi:hypothetical protein
MKMVWQNDGGDNLKWGLGFDDRDQLSQLLDSLSISK